MSVIFKNISVFLLIALFLLIPFIDLISGIFGFQYQFTGIKLAVSLDIVFYLFILYTRNSSRKFKVIYYLSKDLQNFSSVKYFNIFFIFLILLGILLLLVGLEDSQYIRITFVLINLIFYIYLMINNHIQKTDSVKREYGTMEIQKIKEILRK